MKDVRNPRPIVWTGSWTGPPRGGRAPREELARLYSHVAKVTMLDDSLTKPPAAPELMTLEEIFSDDADQMCLKVRTHLL